MQQYRHIIWDWNGTLFDDAWLCVEIINDLLARRGLPRVDAARYQREFVFPVQAYYARLGFDFAAEPFAVLAAEFVAAYDRRRFECGLQPRAEETLAALAARGCTQSVLSAYEEGRLREMVAFHRLAGYFTHLIGLSDCYAASKIAQGRMFLQELACPPAQVVLIGDTHHDAEVADALGIDCLLIPSGHFSRERLADCGAPLRDSLAEVLEPARVG